MEKAPVKIGGDHPVYPDSLRAAGIEGRVAVRAWIGKDGRVKQVDVLQADHDGFVPNTVAAVRTWRFEPALQHGQPVEVWLTIPIRFRQEETALPPEPLAPQPDTTSRPDLSSEIPETLLALTPEENARLTELLQRSAEACAALPERTLVFEDGSFRFESPLTPDEETEWAACLASQHRPPMTSPRFLTQPSSLEQAQRASVRLMLGIVERVWLRISGQ